jgi:uridine kinase
VDYERFKQEVLTPLLSNQAFSYRPYDCAAEALTKEIHIEIKTVAIIEGSYSLHPTLCGMYDIKVFLTIDKPHQMERLKQRNPALLKRFADEWIPLEELYFKSFNVQNNCDMVLR